MMDLKRSYCETSPSPAAASVMPPSLPSMSPQPPQFQFSQQSTSPGVYAFQAAPAPAPAPAPATGDGPAQTNGPVSPKKSMSKANALMKGLKISSDPASASPSDAAVASQPRRGPNASTTINSPNNLSKTKKRSPKAAVPASAPTPEVQGVASEAGAPGDAAAGPSGAGAVPPSRRARPPPRWQRNKKKENDSQSNITNHRIIITGFPVYTSERELVMALRKHGLNPSIELAGGKAPSARATFTTDAEAYAALLASEKIYVNGHFVELKPYNEHYLKPDVDRGSKRNNKRQAFPKSKQKYEIVRPSELDLSGSFEEQLERVLASIRLTQEEVDRVQLLYQDLQDTLRQEWPGCVALPFGSITTGLGIKSSDADCFIALAGSEPQGVQGVQGVQGGPGNPVGRTKRLLQQRPETFAEVLAIPRANTPIVKFYHLPTRTNCDVSFKTPLGVRNSRLVAHLLRARPRLPPLAVLLKYWARVHRLSGSGRLTNYALVLLLLFYLQQPPRRLLPPVAHLQRDAARELLVDGWNTGFDDTPLAPPTGPAAEDATVADLAGGFFEYYAAFPFHTDVVCPYLGAALPKSAFHEPGRLPAEFARYERNAAAHAYGLRVSSALCVQDPFEQWHNVTSGVPSRLFADIKQHIKFAAAAYRESRPRGCDTFLRKILLEAPGAGAGAAERLQGEYELRLPEELLESIAADDWRAPVRDAALTVFEKMLLVELTRDPAPRRPPARERYSGSLTKPIWKRKRRDRADDDNDAEGLVAREAQVTGDVPPDERRPVQLEFSVELRLSDEPRRASIAVSLERGSRKAFREFGRFLVYHDFWFVTLLRPHLRRDCRAGWAAATSPAQPPSDEELLDEDEDEERKREVAGDDSADSKDESGGSDTETDSAANSEGASSPGGRQ